MTRYVKPKDVWTHRNPNVRAAREVFGPEVEATNDTMPRMGERSYVNGRHLTDGGEFTGAGAPSVAQIGWRREKGRDVPVYEAVPGGQVLGNFDAYGGASATERGDSRKRAAIARIARDILAGNAEYWATQSAFDLMAAAEEVWRGDGAKVRAKRSHFVGAPKVAKGRELTAEDRAMHAIKRRAERMLAKGRTRADVEAMIAREALRIA